MMDLYVFSMIVGSIIKFAGLMEDRDNQRCLGRFYGDDICAFDRTLCRLFQDYSTIIQCNECSSNIHYQYKFQLSEQ